MKIAVFDICGTLYNSNTTFDFFLFYFERNNRLKFLLFKFCLSKPMKAFWKLLSLFGKQKMIRKFLIGFIKNENISKVNAEANIFVNKYLELRKIIKVESLFKEQLSTVDEIIFASASIEPVVKAIAEKFQVKTAFYTELVKNKDIYTGVIKYDMEGRKHLVIERFKKDNNVKETVFFTDNKEDIQMILNSSHSTVVSKSKNLIYWKNKQSKRKNIKIIVID